MEFLFEGGTDFQQVERGNDVILIKSVYEKPLENGDTFTGDLDMITGDIVSGVRLYRNQQEQYDGDFSPNGLRHGEGVHRQLSGERCKFVGCFKDNEFEHGTLLTRDFTYSGEFKGGNFSNPIFNGYGTIAFRDKMIYEGDFQEGDFEGLGTLTNPKGDSYNGMFHHGKKCGLGTMRYADASRYTGDWQRDLRHGEGVWTTKNRVQIYRGEFQSDKPHGQGCLRTANLQMKGSWIKGQPMDGTGWTLNYPRTGLLYKGAIKCGRPHGKGSLTQLATTREKRNMLLFTGTFSCGLPAFSNHRNENEDENKKIAAGESSESSPQTAVEDALRQFFDFSTEPHHSAQSSGENEKHDEFFFKEMMVSRDWAANLHKILASSDGQTLCPFTKISVKKESISEATLTLIDGSEYVGLMRDGIMNGHATFVDAFNDSRFVGPFRDGVKHGDGKEYYKDGKMYNGRFVNGLREGLGELYDSKGELFYKGEWKKDYMHGKGLCRFDATFPCPGLYEGEFRHGHRDGRGTQSNEGIAYEGDWSNGAPLNGEWVVNYPSGSIYFGNASFSTYSGPPIAVGFGSLREESGTFYRGEFMRGQRNGSGVCLLSSGETLDGIWENDKFISGGPKNPTVRS